MCKELSTPAGIWAEGMWQERSTNALAMRVISGSDISVMFTLLAEETLGCSGGKRGEGDDPGNRGSCLFCMAQGAELGQGGAR